MFNIGLMLLLIGLTLFIVIPYLIYLVESENMILLLIVSILLLLLIIPSNLTFVSINAAAITVLSLFKPLTLLSNFFVKYLIH